MGNSFKKKKMKSCIVFKMYYYVRWSASLAEALQIRLMFSNIKVGTYGYSAR